MTRSLLLGTLLSLISYFSFSQSVPFPPQPNPNILAPWGYQQVGTNWDTSPYLPFKFGGIAFRLMPPNGVTYNAGSNTWTNASPGTKYPLILFFHGLGETGTDNNNQLRHGGQTHRDAVLSGEFPGFLFYPQAATHSDAKMVLEKLISTLPIDINRIYVHGLSAGAGWTYQFSIAYPTLVAAMAPMSGVDDNMKRESQLYTPIRLAQGGKDTNPAPWWSQQLKDWFDDNGGHMEYFYFPSLGHGTWNSMYALPDFFTWFLSHSKNQIQVLYDRNEICPGNPVSVTMGFTPGFEGYEWRKDGVLMSGQNNYKITVTQFGVYTGRILNRGVWSDWSAPVEVKTKAVTATPPIQVSALHSNVLPAVDGSTTTVLELPTGYEEYSWMDATTNQVLGTERVLSDVGPGQYKAVVKEFNGCSSTASPVFQVGSTSNGSQPDQVNGLIGYAVSQTELALTWTDNPTPIINETGFEIYRATAQTGPFKLVAITGADVVNFNDPGLLPNTKYYYKVRPVTQTSAAAASAAIEVTTQVDSQLPTTPYNLRIVSNSLNSVSLSWGASSDNVGVYRYDIYKNGVKTLAVNGTSATVYNLQGDNIYNFVVRARDITGNLSPESNQVTLSTYVNGLLYSRYSGFYSSLPDFNSINPQQTGITSNVNLVGSTSWIAFKWEGYINIPTAGTYTFETRSDDGSKLYIGTYDEANLVVDNDGTHSMQSRTGTYTFAAAGRYPIVVTYFHRSGSYGMEVYWTGPGITRRLIPNSAFANPSTPSGTAPTAPNNTAVSAVSYKQINVTWNDRSSDETAFKVYRSTSSSTNFVAIGTTTATSYADTTCAPSTRYYYRVEAINQYGSSGFSGSTPSAVTLPLPAPPTAPSNLVGTAVSATSVGLTWSDNSTSETSYQLYRSAGNNTNFVLYKTLPSNTTSFTDTGLLANFIYYYRVHAVGVGGTTNSNVVSVTTLNNVPAIADIADISIRYGIQINVNIFAEDADNEPILLTATGLPSFLTLTDYGDGTGLITGTPTQAQAGTFNITVSATDQNSGVGTESFTLIVSEQDPPTLTPISNLTLNENSSGSVSTIAASGLGVGSLVWTTTGLPPFASFSVVSGQATITFAPNYTHSGVYPIQVKVTDPNGGEATASFVLSVTDINPNTTILVNMVNSTSAGTPWNNVTGLTASNLIDNAGQSSGVGIQFQTTAWNTWYEGAVTGNGSGVFPDNVIKDYYYFGIFGAPNTVDVLVTGLDPAKVYNFSFLGSSQWTGVPDNGSTVYTINGNSASLNVQNNNQNLATLNGIVPNSSGQVTFTMSKGGTSPLGYLNGFSIAAVYQPGTAPAAPRALAANFTDGSVSLSWVDAPFNEDGFNVYKATNAAGPFVQLNGTLLPQGSTHFSDADVVEGATYYYRVDAVNSAGTSSSSVITVDVPDLPPMITLSGNLTISTSGISVVNVSATDYPANNVTLTVTGLPSFAQFTPTGSGNTGSISFNPTATDLGAYNFVITATDPAAQTTTRNVTVVVEEAVGYRVYVNFGNNFSGASPWNNTSKVPAANDLFSNLKDDSNTATGISLRLVTGFGGVYNEGGVTGDNSGVVPDAVLQEYYWFGAFGAPNEVTLRLSGLPVLSKYNVKFMASSVFSNNGAIANNGSTVFSAGGKTASVNVQGNTSQFAIIKDLVTNSAGEITITLSKGGDATAGYLNALILEAMPLDESQFYPSDLVASGYSQSQVTLQWIDNSPTETGFAIFRSNSGNPGTFTEVATVGADVTTYADNAVTPGQLYYYQVRANLPSGPTAFSNISSAGTITFQIFVNLNGDAVYDAPAPWNNTSVFGLTGDVFYGFKDDKGQPTGLQMRVKTELEGKNNWGMNTGNNSGIFPDNVLNSFYFNDAFFPVGKYVIEGLDLGFKYNFGFLGSIVNVGVPVSTNFIIGEKVTTNRNDTNISNVSYIRGVDADENSEVEIVVQEAPGSPWSIWNAMVIQAYPSDTRTNSGSRTNKNLSPGNREVRYGESRPQLVLYPNPAVSELTVRTEDSSLGEIQYTITDMMGKVIDQGVYTNSKVTMELAFDLNKLGLSSSMYMVRLKYPDGKTLLQKFVKK